jgi:CHRD domain/PEP-CTERM motif
MKASILAVAAALLSGTTAFAGVITYSAVLGNFENPPTGSAGTGFAQITVDTVLNTMLVNVTFSGLGSGDTASHIHCCVAQGGNAGVATTTPTFTGFPSGVTSGTYNHTFDLTLSSSWNPAFITANGGTTASAEAVLVAGLAANQTYLNIHTSNFGGGEIRGFLVQAPEPGSFLLAGAVLAGFLFRRRALASR